MSFSCSLCEICQKSRSHRAIWGYNAFLFITNISGGAFTFCAGDTQYLCLLFFVPSYILMRTYNSKYLVFHFNHEYFPFFTFSRYKLFYELSNLCIFFVLKIYWTHIVTKCLYKVDKFFLSISCLELWFWATFCLLTNSNILYIKSSIYMFYCYQFLFFKNYFIVYRSFLFSSEENSRKYIFKNVTYKNSLSVKRKIIIFASCAHGNELL
jgi:hypothetical protein